jgi:uncharacterized protein (DUF2336 family)
MLSFFKKLFGIRGGYKAQKEKLARGAVDDLRQMAADVGTHPEILFYLAKNDHNDIRKSVAENKATPVQASALLVRDNDVDVRLALAQRLMGLLPGLENDRQAQLYAYAVQALGLLAQDEVFQVRKALSTVLRDYAKAPPAVVSRLARDVEREVSEPILRFCAALSDDELLDIISHHPEPWVISSIASRDKVSMKVSKAVVESGDVPGTAVLVHNPGAELSEETLRHVIDRARQYPEWHRPIALRRELSLELARKLAGFVDHAVLRVLEDRSDFDPATKAGIASIVKRKLDYMRSSAPDESALQKIARLKSSGGLTPDMLHDALSWHETEFVVMGLAEMSGIHPQIVKKMLSLGTPKPVLALCWKAKLPMRLCIEIQRDLAKIPPTEIMYAKGGTDYPLSQADLKWQLEFFGIRA